MAKSKPESAPANIDFEEELKLWVRAGGRCAVCNAYLLEDEFVALDVKTGEMAHIVGRAKSSRSPRGLDTLPIEKRNLAENLVLLCPNQHTTVDKKTGQAAFPVEKLQALKRRHEDRIRNLTGLGQDAETVVIRLVGNIRGRTVELAAETVRQAVHDQNRFPRYELGVRSESDIEIDLRKLPKEGEELYWQAAAEKIKDVIGAQLAEGVVRGHVRHLSVFAFARIPALVMLGDALDDKIPAELYEHHRDAAGWRWPEGEEPVGFEFSPVGGAKGAKDVTLVCSLSGSVSLDDLPQELHEETTIYELRPVSVDPVTDLIRTPETLASFSAAYRSFLAAIEKAHPDASALNVLGALPLTAAVELGRRRTQDVHPPLRVWDRADGGYTLAVEVGA